MNRTLPHRDYRHRCADPRRPSGSARSVPGAFGLVSGTAPHFRSYRKKKYAANIGSAIGREVATLAPRLAHVRAERGDWQYWPTPVAVELGALNQTDQPHQHHGSDSCSDQTPDQSASPYANDAEKPASYEAAHNAKDQISDQTVAATHQLPREPAGYQADDEKPQKMHIALSSVRAAKQDPMPHTRSANHGADRCRAQWGPENGHRDARATKKPAAAGAGRAWGQADDAT